MYAAKQRTRINQKKITQFSQPERYWYPSQKQLTHHIFVPQKQTSGQATTIPSLRNVQDFQSPSSVTRENCGPYVENTFGRRKRGE